ncbi:uncharacterized protein K02A2.6-like [Lytechinus pictus]|uniref:uncharacterized protein K02A2.6-like n=1 Tax=Lytechinus pictus TaxID=7653 RepID=UPI0030B9F9CE
MGIESKRRLARETVFWPNINKDIDQLIKQCETCQKHQARQQKEPLHPHDVPPAPWTRLGTDLFMLNRQEYLLVTDYYSKYPIIAIKANRYIQCSYSKRDDGNLQSVRSTRRDCVRQRSTICRKTIPRHVQEVNIKHITSSPHYPRSNGLAERMVRTIKNLLTKCSQTSQDSQLAMMHLRATPVDNYLRSPAEMLFGRPIRTTLPSHYLSRDSAATEFLLNRQDKMKEVHDRHASSDLPPLHVGQPVRVLHPRDHTWIPAKVSKVCE